MASKENTFIGVFNDQAEVLSKVAELKAQGFNENDMYIVGRDHNSFSSVHEQTDVHVDATSEQKKQGFMGKVMSALSGDASLAAFKGMGLERYEAKEYYEQVQNGKLVLYVDSEYGSTYDEYGSNYKTDYTNSAGMEQTAPIETGATFAPSSTSGSAAETDATSGDSTNTQNTYSSASGTGSASGSTADADSDFGKSISASGTPYEPSSGGIGNLFGSTSRSMDSSDSASGITEPSSGTQGSAVESSTDAGSTGNSSINTGSTSGLSSNTSGDAFDSSGVTEEERLRLHEERLTVGKERVQTGEVNVGKHVVEETQSVDVPVEREEVYVERRPVNEEAAGTEAFEENDTIHVPVSEERVNVSKTDVVSEEIVVSKRKVQDTEQVNETVRREVADIDEDTNEIDNKNKNDRF